MRFQFLLAVSTLLFAKQINAKIHSLVLSEDSRRNILLSKFGYGVNGSLDFALQNFTVPEAVLKQTKDGGEDKFGVIGFTLSRGKDFANGIRTNPHLCQLQQQDQGIDALFFVFDFSARRLLVVRSGHIQHIKLCASEPECPYLEEGERRNGTSTNSREQQRQKSGGLFGLANLFGGNKDEKMPYLDYVPVEQNGGQYSTQFAVRFNAHQKGFYYLHYHNCFNYRAHGYSDRVAVDFSVNVVERNLGSFLSMGDIPKPAMYIYAAFLFALATILWANVLCKSESKNIFKVHRLMLFLVFLKTLSLFFHGINYYFVSVYGHQRELWAIIYYVTHLLKGALLFGTVILIGTGYTFFKAVLSDRDRRLFVLVLPLQILDNIAMVIIEESEFGDQRYYFWFEIFVFLDLICCMAIIFPVLWSIRHLEEGAKTDGKAAFNLEKLRIFRHFYVIVIAYIYATRVLKFVVEYMLPQEEHWIAEAVVELSSLFFFCLVGVKFRPVKSNPYLRLTQDTGADGLESGFALTSNGLFEKVTRVQRISVQDELDDNSDEDEREDTTHLGAKRTDISLL